MQDDKTDVQQPIQPEGVSGMQDDKVAVQQPTKKIPFTDQHKNNYDSEDFLAAFSSYWLDRADTIIYAIVGTSFLIGALCALGYSFWNFGFQMTEAFAQSKMSTKISLIAPGIIQFVSDLLLVLIIMEVLGTVLHYLKAHTTSLRPFLFIGIVSATRSILSIGARLSIEGSNVDSAELTTAMIELGVSAAVVLALGITIKLLGSLLEENELET